MLLTGREMPVLLGKSKLFLARLASQDSSQGSRASEIDWLSDSIFVLSGALCEILSIYFRVNF